MAYFTDPMSDEFRKAIEQALKDMEKNPKRERKKRATPKRSKKPKISHLSKKIREELR